MDDTRAFVPGDRVVVEGGYDMDPGWLAGEDGRPGTLIQVAGPSAVVQLDLELTVDSAEGTMADFGTGSATPTGWVKSAQGRWLALIGAYEDHEWREPIDRLHVGLCDTQPNLAAMPPGGGIGVWVESHATIRHED